MANLLNISFGESTYKSAKCKCCGNKIAHKEQILSVVRAQGSFNSVSNFCLNCSKTELESCFKEIMPLAEKIIKTQEILDNLKA